MQLCIHNWVDRKFGSFCMSESNKRLEFLANSTESSRFPVLIQSLVIVSGAFLYASAAASSSSMQISKSYNQTLMSLKTDCKGQTESTTQAFAF